MSENKDESTIDNGEYVEFKINPIELLLMIFLWLIIGYLFSSYAIALKEELIEESKNNFPKVCVFVTIPIILFYVAVSWNMNYVRLSKDYLCIKNDYLRFRKVVFRNSDIKEVIIERIGQNSNARNYLIIVTNDLETQKYGFAFFGRRTLFKLKNTLVDYGINVNDKMNLTEEDLKTFIG